MPIQSYPPPAPAEPGRVAHFIHHFACDGLATRNLLSEIDGHLSRLGLSSDDRGTLELILAEALNNIFEHAYEAGTGPVELFLTVEGASVICELRDLGLPMPGGAAPITELPLAVPGDLPEGGFGWYIIRSLVSDLRYERGDGLNFLRLTVPLMNGCPS